MTAARSISERAREAVIAPMSAKDIRQHLSEQVRLAERTWSQEEDNASRLEEGKTILRDEMILNLMDAGEAKSAAEAERIARTSAQFRGYLKKMHDARRAANDARAEWRKLERDYWASVSDEASERAHMRMSR